MGQVSYTHHIQTTPEKVWAIISDVTRLPDWADKESRLPYPVKGEYGSEQQSGVDTIWIGTSADGQSATQKVTVWEPPTRLAYELQATEHAPLKMAQTNSFTLTPTEQGTDVLWEVDWQLTGGFSLSSLIVRFTANGSFEEMMMGSLKALQQMLEQPDDDETAPQD